jgi:hypothetical protein
MELAKERNFLFFETSAKTMFNVEEAFSLTTIKLIEFYSENEDAYKSSNKRKQNVIDKDEKTRKIETKNKVKKCAC